MFASSRAVAPYWLSWTVRTCRDLFYQVGKPIPSFLLFLVQFFDHICPHFSPYTLHPLLLHLCTHIHLLCALVFASASLCGMFPASKMAVDSSAPSPEALFYWPLGERCLFALPGQLTNHVSLSADVIIYISASRRPTSDAAEMTYK